MMQFPRLLIPLPDILHHCLMTAVKVGPCWQKPVILCSRFRKITKKTMNRLLKMIYLWKRCFLPVPMTRQTVMRISWKMFSGIRKTRTTFPVLIRSLRRMKILMSGKGQRLYLILKHRRKNSRIRQTLQISRMIFRTMKIPAPNLPRNHLGLPLSLRCRRASRRRPLSI